MYCLSELGSHPVHVVSIAHIVSIVSAPHTKVGTVRVKFIPYVMMIMYRCFSSVVGLPLRSSLGAVSSELHSMSVLSLDRWLISTACKAVESMSVLSDDSLLISTTCSAVLLRMVIIIMLGFSL